MDSHSQNCYTTVIKSYHYCDILNKILPHRKRRDMLFSLEGLQLAMNTDICAVPEKELQLIRNIVAKIGQYKLRNQNITPQKDWGIHT